MDFNKIFGWLQMLSPLFFIGIAKFIDHKDPFHKQICLWSFSGSVLITGIMLLYIRFRIKSTSNQTEIWVPEPKDMWNPPDEEPEEEKKPDPKRATQKAKKKEEKLVKMTIEAYDMSRWDTQFKTKFIMTIGITTMLFKWFDMVVPLLIQAITGFLMHWNSELCRVHVRGQDDTKGNLVRPWEDPTPGEEMMKRFGLDQFQAASTTKKKLK